jgi:hypothetical protein
VHVSCRVHPPQLSLYELIPEPTVWHVQQQIGGNLLADDGHTLILAIAERQRWLLGQALDLHRLAGAKELGDACSMFLKNPTRSVATTIA